MLSLASTKHHLRSSQPSLKARIVNENGPVLRTKIVLQQVGMGKRALPQAVSQRVRVFGRNISNIHNMPASRRLRGELKPELRKDNGAGRLRRASGVAGAYASVNASLLEQPLADPLEAVRPVLVPVQPVTLTLSQPMEVDSSPVRKSANPQACDEYVGEIDEYLRAVEHRFQVNPNYMSQQPDINEKMREILVDWLVDVHIRFKLLPETLFLTVSLIDRYLEKEHIKRDKLQLLGVTAMLIAAKYEEIYPPEVKDFAYITDNAYSRNDILAQEENVLKTLDFNLTSPSSFRFLQRFTQTAGCDEKIGCMAQYVLELSLTQLSMLKYPPSVTAASALSVAHTSFDKVWLHKGTESTLLSGCVNDMTEMVRQAGKSSMQAVRRKFSAPKYMEVAKSKPLPF